MTWHGFKRTLSTYFWPHGLLSLIWDVVLIFLCEIGTNRSIKQTMDRFQTRQMMESESADCWMNGWTRTVHKLLDLTVQIHYPLCPCALSGEGQWVSRQVFWGRSQNTPARCWCRGVCILHLFKCECVEVLMCWRVVPWRHADMSPPGGTGVSPPGGMWTRGPLERGHVAPWWHRCVAPWRSVYKSPPGGVSRPLAVCWRMTVCRCSAMWRVCVSACFSSCISV